MSGNRKSRKTPDRMLGMSKLKERGWTESMVRTLLGKPDGTRVNPHYKCAAPMRLYAESRIMQAEASKAFCEHQTEAKRRVVAARRGVETKLAAIIDEANQVSIRFTRELPETYDALYSKAKARALREYKRCCKRREGDAMCGECEVPDPDEMSRGDDSPPAFTPPKFQGVCSYVRHNFTNYESILDHWEGRTGRSQAYEHLRRRLDRQIAQALVDKYGLAEDVDKAVEVAAERRRLRVSRYADH